MNIFTMYILYLVGLCIAERVFNFLFDTDFEDMIKKHQQKKQIKKAIKEINIVIDRNRERTFESKESLKCDDCLWKAREKLCEELWKR